MYKVTWDEYFQRTKELIQSILESKVQYDSILAISRGGTIVGTILSHRLKLPMSVIISQSYDNDHQQREVWLSSIITPPSLKSKLKMSCLIVDDLLDTGKTIDAIRETYKDNFDVAALYHKGKCKEPTYCTQKVEDWIEFPYEEFA